MNRHDSFAIPGQIYQLQHQDSVKGISGTSVSPGFTVTGPPTWMKDMTGGSAQRFFRVKLLMAILAPEIQSLVVASGVATVTWSAVVGQDYPPEHNDSLLNASWTLAPMAVTATAPLTSSTSVAGTLPHRVDRVAHGPRE